MISVGETLARHLATFGELPAADYDAVAALRAEVRDVPRQTDVLRNGDHPTHVVVVLSGLLHRYTIGPEGKRQIHSFYLPNEAPSLETLYIDYMDNNLATVVPTRVGLISHDQIYRIIDERPEARKLLWRQTLVQAAIFRQWLVRNSNLPAHMALAHLFCEMYVRADAVGLVGRGTCSLPLTQEYVADALGLTAVHTNRTLQALRQSNLIGWNLSEIQIPDLAAARDFAQFDGVPERARPYI
jgi:CRP-like cAMP-binding protein